MCFWNNIAFLGKNGGQYFSHEAHTFKKANDMLYKDISKICHLHNPIYYTTLVR